MYAFRSQHAVLLTASLAMATSQSSGIVYAQDPPTAEMPAETAEEWGLIWKCIDDDDLQDEAQKMALHLATQPTRALGRIKKLLNESSTHTLIEQTDLEQQAMQEFGQSDNYREGVAAFMEKRPPVFKG